MLKFSKFRHLQFAIAALAALLPWKAMAQPTMGTLNVVITDTGIPYWPVRFGSQFGAWNDSGLTVNLIIGTPANAAALLASGKADVFMGTPQTLALAVHRGLPAKLVAARSLTWGQNLVVSPQSGIKDLADLKGKTFGVSAFSSQGYFSTVKLAQALGWSRDDYKIAQLSNLQGLVAGLKSGAIQAFAWNPQQVSLMAEQGTGVDFGPLDPYVGPNSGSSIWASDAVIKNRSAELKAFLTGYFNMVKKYRDDPKTVAESIEKYDHQPVGNLTVLRQFMNDWSTDGAFPPANRKGLAESVTVMDPTVKAIDIDSMHVDWRTLP